MLFLQIRKACIISEEKQVMNDELYWLEGFLFHFQNKNDKEDNTTLVEMNTYNNTSKYEIQREIKSYRQIIQIRIVSNFNPQQIFQSIHLAVKEFVSRFCSLQFIFYLI